MEMIGGIIIKQQKS